jgi:hypothetical protein
MLPQQAMVASVLTPHPKKIPTLTDVNVPTGGVARPYRLTPEPQQAMVLSVFRPHANPAPALTDTNEPAGGIGE